MDWLGRWVWQRWRSHFGLACVAAMAAAVQVFVVWPVVAAGTLVLDFDLSKGLVFLAYAGGYQATVVPALTLIIGRSSFRLFESWGRGDRSAPERVRAAVYAFPRRVVLLVGAASFVPFLVSWTLVFAAITDESSASLILIVVAAIVTNAIITGGMAVGYELLLRPVREELSLELAATGDAPPRGWRARPRLLFGVVSAALGPAVVTGAAVTKFESLEGQLSTMIGVGVAAALFTGLTARARASPRGLRLIRRPRLGRTTPGSW